MTPTYAARIAIELEKDFPVETYTERHMRNALALAEEAGEAVAAIRRYLGLARRTGTLDQVAEELADVIITANIIAHYMGIDPGQAVNRKVQQMFDRGFKNADR